MRNLNSYFKVVFASPEISNDNHRKFTEIHLQRLAADNPEGMFTPLVTATTAAYQAYFGAIVDEAPRTAIQMVAWPTSTNPSSAAPARMKWRTMTRPCRRYEWMGEDADLMGWKRKNVGKMPTLLE
jgi:hypothetical protein